MTFLNNFFFNYYPYIVLSFFFIGSIYRYENSQYTWKSGSSQILRNNIFLASNFFHFGILFLIFGHFFGLMTPKIIYSKFITPESKQLVAIIVGGTAGFFCLFGLTFILYRRFFDIRIRKNSNKSDFLVLILLYFQLLLGLFSILISVNHLDNPSSMISLAHWVQGIFIFDENLYHYITNEHWIFKLHLILGMTILLIFPFTRLIHIFSFPYLYFLRTGYQIVRILK